MSRGKNANAFRRGNRTLAWYMDSKVSKVLDQADVQERDTTTSPALHRRKNSFDSESSLNSNGRQTVNEADERKRRANKARAGRQRSQNSQNEDTDPPSIVGSAPSEHPIVGSEQQAAALQQHLFALSTQATQEKGRENYWYYDAKSDGFFYEYVGSRGWRKRNPTLHGNLPINVPNKAAEETNIPTTKQTIEKVYVPIPVPVFTNGSKFFPQAGTSPNIKYYDPNSDGFVFETASVDGWKKRNTNSGTSMHSMLGQSPRVEPSSLVSFPPLGRDLTSRELEELILAKMKNAPNGVDKTAVPFASVVSRGLKTNVGIAPQREPEYPSSSSTVSSSVSSDNATPPPNGGKENQCQQLFAQTKEPTVGSFEEPYEFYWSDSEKPESVQPTEQAASSVSSVDEFNPLSAYFNEISMNNQPEKQNLRVQRPSSLKIVNPPPVNSADKRLPNFNIDRFIADLPGNDNFMNGMSAIYAPLGTDSPRTPFNQYSFTKESPMYTPMLPKENAWARFNAYKQEEFLKDKAMAESSIERGLRDIEKIWN